MAQKGVTTTMSDNQAKVEAQEDEVETKDQPSTSKKLEPLATWNMSMDIGIIYIKSHLGVNVEPITKVQPTPNVSSHLALRRIHEWPQGCGLRPPHPIFELEEKMGEYQRMKCDMKIFYDEKLRGYGAFPINQLKAGMVVVYAGSENDGDYERAKVLTVFQPKDERHLARLYLIDQGTVIIANAAMLLFLFKQFDLPQRARHFKPICIRSYYNNLQAFLGLLSPSCGIWDGTLTANRHHTFGWTIFSDLVPERLYTFGISEYIIRRLILEHPFIPEVGDILEGTIVHTENEGRFWFQSKTPFSEQQNKLESSLVDFWIKEDRCDLASYAKPGKIVMAPFQDKFYRAIVEQVDSKKKEMTVFFMDYGNTMVFPLDHQSIRPASYMHPVYELLPQTVKLLQLNNTKSSTNLKNFDALFKFVNDDKSTWARVLNQPDNGCRIVEIIKPCPEVFITGRLDLSLPHLVFDGQNMGENAPHPCEPRTIAPTGLVPRRLAPQGPFDKDIGETSTAIRWDYCTRTGAGGMGLERLFTRVGIPTTFKIVMVNQTSATVVLQPSVLVPWIQALEKDLLKSFNNPLCKTDNQLPRFWSRGSCYILQSQMLGRPVRCQLHSDKGNSKEVKVHLVDYGIMETSFIDHMRHLSFEQCQLVACGMRAILTRESETEPMTMDELLKHDECEFTGQIQNQSETAQEGTLWKVTVQSFQPKKLQDYFYSYFH